MLFRAADALLGKDEGSAWRMLHGSEGLGNAAMLIEYLSGKDGIGRFNWQYGSWGTKKTRPLNDIWSWSHDYHQILCDNLCQN